MKKKILSNANLREVSYRIIVYKIRIENMFKNIKKDRTTIFVKTNNCIYSEVIIDKIE